MMTFKKVTIPYSPRPIWKNTIHPALDKHRFSVLVCHRRFGKTVGSVNHIVKKACKNKLRAPRYAYLAPYRNQAKLIAWSYLKYYTSTIPGVKANESELYIEIPSIHVSSEGARIYIIGADHPDALRGAYWDGVVLDEFAQIKPTLWGEVIRPALADRGGWAVFIGTPKGQNQFYEMYLRAIKKENWFACLYTAEETGVLPDEEIADMKEDMSNAEYRQELLCDFSASAFNILIPIDLISASIKKHYRKEDIKGAVKIIAVDVARYGNDSSTISKREGLVVYQQRKFKDINNMELASQVALEIDSFRADAVFIDGGRGEGVIDRLRQLGYTNIIEVNFGARADEHTKYINKRVEMYVKGKKWLDAGGNIPDDPELKQELSMIEYGFNAVNKMKLSEKDDIKEKLGRSPDKADGFALLFAHDVKPAGIRNRSSTSVCNNKYDPFNNI